MILMLDTNVILDILLKREPFFYDSFLTAVNIDENGDAGIISASAVTDLFYVIKKSIGTVKAREAISNLKEFFTVASVESDDIDKAVTSGVFDFEDALVSVISKKYNADYIITRNKADFGASPVPAISPKEFLQLIGTCT